MELATVNQLVSEALVAQDQEEADSFAEWSSPFIELSLASDPEMILHATQALASGTLSERQLYARIIANLSALSPTRRYEEARRMLSVELDPKVIRWLILAIRNSRSRNALDILFEASNHESADVRYLVPDALSACATSFHQVFATLLTLSKDSAEDVRWSATYEIIEWCGTTPESAAIRRLEQIRAAGKVDSVDRIRAVGATESMAPDDAADLVAALEHIAYVRLQHQRRQLEAGLEPDNHLDPTMLNRFERDQLKMAFVTIDRHQDAMRRHFRTGQMG